MATVVPQWMLRRLAGRLIRIVGRRAPQSPAIEPFLHSAVPSAEEFIVAYDRAIKSHAHWKNEMAAGRGAILALHRAIRTWVPLVRRDLPSLDTTGLGNQPDVPDKLIADGERLARLISDHRDSQGNSLPYQQAALEALTPALQAAAKAWAKAEAADAQHQQLLAVVRALATRLQKQLVTLRRSLLAVLGRTSKDYQKLRVENASQPDEDDDPTMPPPPKPPLPRTPGAGRARSYQ